MAFSRPQLQQIISRIKTDIETRLETGKLLVNSFLSIIATALGGAVHGLYGFIDWAVRQLFPDTAEAEYLERWASIWGIPRTPADFAEGQATFTGSNGTVIPEGTIVKRSDDFEFTTTAEATITGGTATVDIIATDAGASGNTDTGTQLSMITPIAGLDSVATVTAPGLAGGADAEGDEALRARLINRIQEPPHGGASFDYIKWAKEVSGVTRAFVYPQQYGLGTVGVAILEDNSETGPAASPAKVTEAQEYIEEKRPVTADVTVWTPTAVPIDFEITISPDTTAIRAAVEANLREMLIRVAEPGKTIPVSKIRESVSVATGEDDNVVSDPVADVTCDELEILTFGEITWL